MRVHELASELDTESSAVIEAAQAAGIDVNHASNSLSDEEAATLREALAPAGETGTAEPAGADAEATPKKKAKPKAERKADVVLTGKASVTADGRKILRGEAPPAKWLATAPKRVRAWFSPAGEPDAEE